jgi:pyrimidine operon attenuation protein / uracil phosphoribosyltransferase
MTHTSAAATELPDMPSLYERMRAGLIERMKGLPADEVHLVGIHSGGAWLAQRLHQDLGIQTELGTLNISFYRDDFDRIGLHPQVKPSDIGFAVADRHLILIDDVLYTGRTIRAAMNELFDYGRAASIQLVVLVDRGARELPICADFAALHLQLPASDNVVLTRTEEGEFSLDIETKGS